MTKAKATDATKLAELPTSGGPWNTVLGEIGYGKKGDGTDSGYIFYILKNGSYAQM